MLNSEKNFSLCVAKKINILTRVVEKKHHNPPFKLNGQSLSTNICEIELNQSRTNNHSLTLSLTYISTNICEIELNQSRTNNHSLTLSLTYISTNICEIELNQSRTNKQELECVSWMNLNTVQPVLKGTSV